MANISAMGGHFAGVVLSTILYGITMAQIFSYFRAFSSDPRLMKFIVLLLFLFDTTQVSLVVASIYSYTIGWRGDHLKLQYVSQPFIVSSAIRMSRIGILTNLLKASMGVTCVVAFTVQMIYAYRVWRLSGGNVYLSATIVSLALVALGSAAAMIAKTLRNPRWDEARVSTLPAGIILASTVTCDLLIALAQVWLFHRDRLATLDRAKRFTIPFPLRRSISTTSISSPTTTEAGCSPPPLQGPLDRDKAAADDNDGRRLGSLLTTLTILVINVGLLTSLDACLFFALFLACPQTGLYLVPYILLSNCYVNSFLSLLNSRRLLRNLVENPDHFNLALEAG
ncbi:hypothetical protein MIND_00792700 [Mycena indigotica]|uniref:DUF6534 domain-containing protein n=1 Tax=Mycena indigotica TaxID=2126181 RepID=A0A8H6SNY4_9AGAR|nr:uncharacterized protein MIND_00792700 [Mycena indigotica]KAF7302257.1 hypothetical protein MIND_00792700 [Mycena indigotica]